MSTDREHKEHNHLQPEDSGIKARPVLAFMAILAVATIATFLIIKGLLFAFARMEAAEQTQPASRVALPEGQRKLPPLPRLQGAPGPDGASMLPLEEMKTYREQVDRKAESYGWVDKPSGIAHIPIDRAKDLTVERGLPMRSEASVEEIRNAESMRKLVLGADSSAGRAIGKQ